MFNRSILSALATLSLCAIYTSAAPQEIFLRLENSKYYRDSVDVDVSDLQTLDLPVEWQFQLLDGDNDDSKLAREVAEADYVPPPKHAYETGNGEVGREIIESSRTFDDNEGVEEAEDHEVDKKDSRTSGEIVQDVLPQIIVDNNTGIKDPEDLIDESLEEIIARIFKGTEIDNDRHYSEMQREKNDSIATNDEDDANNNDEIEKLLNQLFEELAMG